MADRLEPVRALAGQDSGLAVAVTLRSDGTPHASVVNAGVFPHPVTGVPVVGFVARGDARKLAHLRARPHATLLWRRGWEWVAVDGSTQLVGPDDPLGGLAVDDLAIVLRTIYASAVGGSADEWASLDEAFAAERHTAVIVTPTRMYSNPSATV